MPSEELVPLRDIRKLNSTALIRQKQVDRGNQILGMVTGAKPRAKTNRIPIYITKTTKKAAYIQGGRVTDPL